MRPVSGKRTCKALERKGWTWVRTNGSHHHYQHPDVPGTVPVPVHANRDMRPGTQRDVMRQAGLTDADL